MYVPAKPPRNNHRTRKMLLSSHRSKPTPTVCRNNSSSTTVNFCGNVVNQMPVGNFVTVSFTQNQGCATLTFIAIETH